MDSIPEKRCSKCKKFFPATTEHFNKSSKASDGLRTECKACRKPFSRDYYERNTGKIKEYVQQWQRDNYEKWREYETKSRHNNPEPSRNSVKRYMKKYPEKRRAQQAVKYAVRVGKLPKVETCLCKFCGEQAEAYHHWSYLPEHKLDVIPLCTMCHNRLHKDMDASALPSVLNDHPYREMDVIP